MKRILLALVAINVLVWASTYVYGLDLKGGISRADTPLYQNLYDNGRFDDDGLIARFEIAQRFHVREDLSINAFAFHKSLVSGHDPHKGLNGIGLEMEIHTTGWWPNFKFGMINAFSPLYENVYDHGSHDDDGLIARFEIIKRFPVTDYASINVYGSHWNVQGMDDSGINFIGTELEFNFDLF